MLVKSGNFLNFQIFNIRFIWWTSRVGRAGISLKLLVRTDCTCVIVGCCDSKNSRAERCGFGHRDGVRVIRELRGAVVDVRDQNADEDIRTDARHRVGGSQCEFVRRGLLEVQLVHNGNNACKVHSKWVFAPISRSSYRQTSLRI